MHLLAAAAGVFLTLFVLWDAFETIVLPRRVSRRFRLTRFFYRVTWRPWRAVALHWNLGGARENYLSIYGPLSLIALLVTWALGLVLSFALLHWGLGTRLSPADLSFAANLYFSGTTFFTLGLGDISAANRLGRILTVVEGGTGFAFLALVIGYLPVLSQAFSRREVNIALLDARAGSPPSAAELIRRHSGNEDGGSLAELLTDWESWSADLLETHVSFPVLAYYRSQHDNQSWVAALTTILDVCALTIVGLERGPTRAAQLTFAMARHAVADLCSVFHQAPRLPHPDRLPEAQLVRLRKALAESGMPLAEGHDVEERLAEIRRMYEPYVNALSGYLLMPLPAWIPDKRFGDNWQRIEREISA